MKPKSIIILILVLGVVVILIATFTGTSDETAYVNKILKSRADKDNFMKTSDESPFKSDPKSFTGLKYFPPDAKYKIVADLVPVKDKKVVILSTNDGKEQRYIEYATAEFDLGNTHNKLTILEIMDMGPYRGKLFLAFGDGTSADETYGAGRYLDVNKVPGAATITLDFNEAYNPYCAYNDSFSCPLPPAENLLRIPIRAGEKTYHP